MIEVLNIQTLRGAQSDLVSIATPQDSVRVLPGSYLVSQPIENK